MQLKQKEDQSVLEIDTVNQPPKKEDQTDLQQLEDELDLELLDDEDEDIHTSDELNVLRDTKLGADDAVLSIEDSSSNNNNSEQLQLDEEEEEDDAEESEDRSWRR